LSRSPLATSLSYQSHNISSTQINIDLIAQGATPCNLELNTTNTA